MSHLPCLDQSCPVCNAYVRDDEVDLFATPLQTDLDPDGLPVAYEVVDSDNAKTEIVVTAKPCPKAGCPGTQPCETVPCFQTIAASLRPGYEVSDLGGEAYREYDFGGRTYRIDFPKVLVTRPGGTTHRVVGHDGLVHCLPAPGQNGCVLRWKARCDKPPVQF